MRIKKPQITEAKQNKTKITQLLSQMAYGRMRPKQIVGQPIRTTRALWENGRDVDCLKVVVSL